MFHEITDKELAKKRKVRIIIICCIVAVLIAAWVAVGAIQQNAKEQGALALRESIVGAAKQCCAIEGSYPSSLEYLEDNYGITINHNDYVVSYESFADNVMPTVVVTVR